MKILYTLVVLLISATQTHAATGDVAVATDGLPTGGWIIIGIVGLVVLIGLVSKATGCKTVEKREKEYQERVKGGAGTGRPSD